MADLVDIAWLTAPVSADEPCGPDLEITADPDYFQCVSRIDGLLPASYFTRDDSGRQIVFDRSKIDFAAESRALLVLLERTRDLRLLTMLGRLCALNRDLKGFAETVIGIAALLAGAWEPVHPHGEDGDYTLRTAVLQGLDDMPTVILPLQHVPLVTTRRAGALTFRSIMVANGEAQPREDEPNLDRPAIERILAEADFEALRATHDRLTALRTAISAIQATSINQAGYEHAVTLDRLPALVDRIVAALAPVLAARDPNAQAVTVADMAGAASDSGSVAVAAERRADFGAVKNVADAARALSAACTYLQTFEPSSPAQLLVRQAEALVGKSFLDVIRVLVPAHVEETMIAIGTDRLFALSYQQLNEVTTANSHVLGSAEDGAPSGDIVPAETSSPSFEVASRPDMLALIHYVGMFYRTAEPSSPIPLLLDRAAGMVERDFLALLKDVLPALVPRRDDN